MNHYKIIKRGVDFWNKWRDKNAHITPDLQDANLIRANLRGANLRGANLRGANFRYANLMFANLSGADLIDANLRDANLKGADLIGADLSSADLIGADLSGVNLWGADLRSVKYPIKEFDKKALLRKLIITLQQEGNELNMQEWHTCKTSHCVGGWLEKLSPEIKEVSEKTNNIVFAVGLAYPRLVKDGVLWNLSLTKETATQLLNEMLEEL